MGYARFACDVSDTAGGSRCRTQPKRPGCSPMPCLKATGSSGLGAAPSRDYLLISKVEFQRIVLGAEQPFHIFCGQPGLRLFGAGVQILKFAQALQPVL